ncbi:MAG: hypothetical protein ACREOP_10770 [Thermodesulfobacteriota bacterium]
MARSKKQTPKKEATAARIIKAIIAAEGNISTAAKKARLSRSTIYEYISIDETVADAAKEAQEQLYDLAESKLIAKIKKEDLTAIIFFLKTRCKHRGYVERQEHTGAGGSPMEVQIYLPENSRDNKAPAKTS